MHNNGNILPDGLNLATILNSHIGAGSIIIPRSRANRMIKQSSMIEFGCPRQSISTNQP